MYWQKISRPGFGVNGNNLNPVMAIHRNDLYVAISNSVLDQVQLWRTNPSNFLSGSYIRAHWSQVATLEDSRRVDSLVSYGGRLLIGDDQSNLFHFRSRGVRNLGGPSTLNLGIRSMAVHKGQLYLLYAGRPLEIWRSADPTLTRWEQIATSITSGSGETNFSGILYSTGDFLYLGTGVETPGGGGLSQLWRTDHGNVWEKWVDNSFRDPENGAVTAITYFDGDLYSATLNHAAGSKVYKVELDRPEHYSEETIPNFAPIRSMDVWGHVLYAGEGNNPSGAAMFRKGPTASSFDFVRSPFGETTYPDGPDNPPVILYPHYLIPLVAKEDPPRINSIFVSSWRPGDVIVWRLVEKGRRYVSDWIINLSPVLWLMEHLRIFAWIVQGLLRFVELIRPQIVRRPPNRQ